MPIEFALAASLRACGHFLYYQTGCKAGQRRILVTMLRQEGITQKALQDKLELSSGALSEILKKMEDASLVVRCKCPDDKRQVTLALTPLGKELALRMKAQYHGMMKKVFSCLSDVEKAQLDGTLAKLAEHMNALRAEPLFHSQEEGLLL